MCCGGALPLGWVQDCSRECCVLCCSVSDRWQGVGWGIDTCVASIDALSQVFMGEGSAWSGVGWLGIAVYHLTLCFEMGVA